MADPLLRGPWPEGINNLSSWKALPNGSLRDAVNVDVLPNGHLALRAGYELAAAGAAVRGALAVDHYVLFADGTNLQCLDTDTSTVSTLRTIAGSGRFVGGVWNKELFFCTENETLRFADGVVRDWGVTTVSNQPLPSFGVGALQAGEYRVAVTFVDAYGDEGGTTEPLLFTATEGSSATFLLPNPPVGGKVRLYMSPYQGSTLYKQAERTSSGLVTVNSVVDSTARLETVLLRAPVPGDFITEYAGSILIADGNVLWMTEPFRPHLRNQVTRFFQYPAPIDGIMASGQDKGVFLLADRTYFLTDLDLDQSAQVVVSPYGGVRGSMLKTEDEFAAWMTRYGLAKSNGQGKATLLSARRFVPELASKGSSGIVEHNGNQLVVTTMNRAASQNTLRASDYYEAEIVTP